MGIIRLETIRCYAHHGCMPEEARIGQHYEVDIVLHADLGRAAETDDLSDTIDYVTINRIAVEQMAIRSKLIEHAAGRILNELFAACPALQRAEVTVRKINPPINGDVGAVSVTLGR